MVEMELMVVLILCGFQSGYHGFLLDGITQPTTPPVAVISDDQFNMLLSLLLREKQARVELEKEVQQIRKDLFTTQQGVTSIYHTGQTHNDTLTIQSSTMKILDDKYTDLQVKYDSLKWEFSELKTNYSILQNHTIQINQELAALKQLKSVNDMQVVLSVQNQSQHLEKELQATNTILNAAANDLAARNQDFVALFNKADATERKLDLAVTQLNMNKNNTDALLLKLENNQNVSQTQLNNTIEAQMSMIKRNQNMTLTNLKTELYDLYLKMPDRVALTACAETKTYQSGSIVLFPNINTRKGISNNGITSLANSGKFVCERPGLYLITAFIMTNRDSSRVDLYKNSDILAYNYFSMHQYYQTHSVSVLEQLNVNDSVYTKTYGEMYISGEHVSCLTILQITD